MPRVTVGRTAAVLWLAFAACLAAMVRETLRFVPATFTRPRTVVSNGNAGFNEPFLVFLSSVADAIPSGSTISVVAPPGRDPRNWPDYILAVGQFPGRRLIFAGRFLPSGGDVPSFAACFGAEFPDPRFRLVRRLPGGNLYAAVR